MEERREKIAGLDTRWFETPGGEVPILYVHGVPNTGLLWRGFLERTGGFAPDLPGFGQSGKPNDFDYSIEGYSTWLSAFLDARGVETFRLVAHDWGAAALALAQARPERVERLVLLDAVPLLPGYRWHRMAALWRRALIGEMTMGFTTRFATRRLLALPDGRPYPEDELDEAWRHFDHGTQRAILRLYRSAPEAVLEAAGSRLGELRCPALVVWGAADPYLPERFAHDYAAALGGQGQVHVVSGAGHWPWLDDPAVVERVAGFLS